LTPTVTDAPFKQLPSGTPGGTPVVTKPGGTIVTDPVSSGEYVGGALDPCKTDPCASSIAKSVAANNALLVPIAAASATSAAQSTPLSITYKTFASCDGTTAKFGAGSMVVPLGMRTFCETMLNKLADIEAQKCIDQTAIASVPEWWQLRPEAHRPQMIYIYRVKNANGTWVSGGYSLTVPHPKNVTAATVVKLPNYTKGNYQSILILSDNSKVIVNGKDAAACEAMINAAKAQIATSYLTNASTKSGVRGGATAFVEKAVQLWAIDYYAKGAADGLKPTWRKLAT
jgi:hypothetical protein